MLKACAEPLHAIPAVVNLIDRFPENGPQIFFYLLMVLGLEIQGSWRRAVRTLSAIERNSLVNDLVLSFAFLACRVVVNYLLLASMHYRFPWAMRNGNELRGRKLAPALVLVDVRIPLRYYQKVFSGSFVC